MKILKISLCLFTLAIPFFCITAPYHAEATPEKPPISEISREEVTRMVEQLDADEWETRDKADRALREMGWRIYDYLKPALNHPSLEIRHRIIEILAFFDADPECRLARIKKMPGYKALKTYWCDSFEALFNHRPLARETADKYKIVELTKLAFLLDKLRRNPPRIPILPNELPPAHDISFEPVPAEKEIISRMKSCAEKMAVATNILYGIEGEKALVKKTEQTASLMKVMSPENERTIINAAAGLYRKGEISYPQFESLLFVLNLPKIFQDKPLLSTFDVFLWEDLQPHNEELVCLIMADLCGLEQAKTGKKSSPPLPKTMDDALNLTLQGRYFRVLAENAGGLLYSELTSKKSKQILLHISRDIYTKHKEPEDAVEYICRLHKYLARIDNGFLSRAGNRGCTGTAEDPDDLSKKLKEKWHDKSCHDKFLKHVARFFGKEAGKNLKDKCDGLSGEERGALALILQLLNEKSTTFGNTSPEQHRLCGISDRHAAQIFIELAKRSLGAFEALTKEQKKEVEG